MKIVTADQMRQIEARCQEAGVSMDTLMENSGLAVAKQVRRGLGRAVGAPVLVLVGPGNNGGDGLVAARRLHAWGARVTVYLCRDRVEADPKLAAVQARDIRVVRASEDTGLANLKQALGHVDLVIDAVLGTGRSRQIEGVLKELLLEVADARTQRSSLQVLALDLPSGLDADSGLVDAASVPADVTVALGYPKVGLYRFPGAEFTGRVEVADIGLPAGLDDDVRLDMMTDEWAKGNLPTRPLSSHKGTFGRTLIVAGSRNYVGAAHLAAAAAARAGAGLVTLAVPESIQMAVAARASEPTYIPLPEEPPGVLSSRSADTLIERTPEYDALLVGCGLGQSVDAQTLLGRLLYSGAQLPPTVVDADGLNFLAHSQDPGWWERLPLPAIVTPHPGEMSRLSSESIEHIQEDRVGKATAAAAKWNKVVVLKGPFTAVAYPVGRAMLSPFTNPGLASAGTGDVLAGAIAGLLSQGLDMEAAAPLGVYLHGLAGERVREELGETGMLASDLLPAIPRVIKGLRGAEG